MPHQEPPLYWARLDVTYEHLKMRGIGQAIDLTQFYDGEGPSTYLFDKIVFKDITEAGRSGVVRPGWRPEMRPVGDCDDH